MHVCVVGLWVPLVCNTKVVKKALIPAVKLDQLI